MNDFAKNLRSEILNSAIGDVTNEDIESTSKMLYKYLCSTKDDKAREEKATATRDFFVFITMTATMLDIRDSRSEETN